MSDDVRSAVVAVAPERVEAPWWQGITRYQWIILLMTSLGLMFDLLDVSLLGLAMSPALRDLLGAGASILLRGTGSGFCFTVGRALSAIGPAMTGMLVARTGSWVTAMTIPTFVYLLGPIVVSYARETKGQPLQT